MKKFVLKVVFFFALFLGANIIYLQVVKNLDWNFAKVIEARDMIDKQFEIIVIGNSLAMDGINTEMLGKAYNLSIGGATLNTNKRQLEEYLESCQKKPKKVILGMTSCTDEDYSRTSIHPIIRYLDSNKFDSFYDLPMIQFKWMAQVLLKKLISKDHREAHLVQGQLRIKRVLADESNLVLNLESNLDLSYYQNISSIGEIDSICAVNDIELIVIEMPGIRSSQNAIPIGPHKVDAYKLFNFNNSDFCKAFDGQKHWLGGSHLNEEGAEVFTAKLIQHLALD